MTIFKIEKRYGYLKTNEFEFPELISSPKDYFKNEMEFMAFFILNPWFYKQFGIINIKRNAYSPDLTADILNFGRKLEIEIEYDARNFRNHNHSTSFTNLIISFIRSEKISTINSIPVWSLYKYSPHHKIDKIYTYTLNEDINYDFNLKNKP